MKRGLIALMATVGGYVIGLFGGITLVERFSSNAHDRPVEAAMTAAFVYGPAAALVAVLAALAWNARGAAR